MGIMVNETELLPVLRALKNGGLLAFVCFVFGAFLFGSPAAQAQSIIKSQYEIQLNFRWDRYELDRNYMENATRFAQLDSLINEVGVEMIDSIKVHGQSSPEGAYQHNRDLSKNRRQAMISYISNTYKELDSKIILGAEGDEWSVLREFVAADKLMKQSTIDQVLSIIDSNVHSTTKQKSLEQLPIYKYLYRTYYPWLRQSLVCVVYYGQASQAAEVIFPNPPSEVEESQDNVCDSTAVEVHAPESETFPTQTPEDVLDSTITAPVQIDSVVVVSADSTSVTDLEEAVETSVKTPKNKKMVAAVSTNLLFDAVTALNASVEIPVGEHWSVKAEDMFPWWVYGNKYAFECWQMGAEVRYWFNPLQENGKTILLSGLYAGPYAMSGKYDFQNDTKLCYQGEFWSAGVTLGYSMPIGRNNFARLSFGLNLGFLQTDYRHYQPASDYSELIRDPYNVGTLSYFGPTKAEVTFTIPIFVTTKK